MFIFMKYRGPLFPISLCFIALTSSCMDFYELAKRVSLIGNAMPK